MGTMLRVAVLYILIIALLRALGKRDLSQMSPQELVMLLLIPEIASQALLRDDFSLTNSLIALTTLMTLVYLTSALNYRFKGISRVIEGEPTILVQRGKPRVEALAKERISLEELGSEMRKAGIMSLEHVKWALLEPDGKISFIGYGEERHSTPAEKSEEAH